MLSYFWLCLYITTGLLVATSSAETPEVCTTKAELEELKTLVRNAFQRNKCDEAVGQLVTRQSLELTALKSELTATTARLGAELQALKTSGTKVSGGTAGSTFIRWGRKSCPDNTTLVYAGIAGGKQYNQAGSGNNRLCLTRTPQFDDTAKPTYFGELYGGEYEWIANHHDQDVPCSVCLVPQSVTIMMPATLTCPTGWTSLYTGHLASQYSGHHASDYVCLDANLEDDVGGVTDQNGLLFYLTVTRCGSLPCPPYINDKVVTCVVCSL